MTSRIAKKRYYSVGEVCEVTNLKPHVLRYWETQFKLLQPPKKGGKRVYTRRHIKLIQLIRHLLHTERYTVEGAKKKMDQLRTAGQVKGAARVAWDRETIKLLRRESEELIELLEGAETKPS